MRVQRPPPAAVVPIERHVPENYGKTWICDKNVIWRCPVLPGLVPGDVADFTCFYWDDVLDYGSQDSQCTVARSQTQEKCGGGTNRSTDPLIRGTAFLISWMWQKDEHKPELHRVQMLDVKIDMPGPKPGPFENLRQCHIVSA